MDTDNPAPTAVVRPPTAGSGVRITDVARFLTCLDGDAQRLRNAAAEAGLDAPVPTCPGWSVADLVRHTAAVYLHKVECVRTGREPTPWPPPVVNEAEPFALFDQAYRELFTELAGRGPATPAFSWYGPDQTVGFWMRRMAQETVVHRFDAEAAAGLPAAPVPADLALDGIDEILYVFLDYEVRTWPEFFENVLATERVDEVDLRAAGHGWRIRFGAGAFTVSPSTVDDPPPGATVSAEPVGLLRWLWNRAGDDGVTIVGDTAAVDRLRTLCARAT